MLPKPLSPCFLLSLNQCTNSLVQPCWNYPQDKKLKIVYEQCFAPTKPTQHFLFIMDRPLTPSNLQGGQTGKSSQRVIFPPLISSLLQWCARQCLTMSLRAGQELCARQRREVWSVAFATFWSVNIPTTADFRLPTWHPVAYKILEMLTTSSCKLVQTNSSMSLLLTIQETEF